MFCFTHLQVVIILDIVHDRGSLSSFTNFFEQHKRIFVRWINNNTPIRFTSWEQSQPRNKQWIITYILLFNLSSSSLIFSFSSTSLTESSLNLNYLRCLLPLVLHHWSPLFSLIWNGYFSFLFRNTSAIVCLWVLFLVSCIMRQDRSFHNVFCQVYLSPW